MEWCDLLCEKRLTPDNHEPEAFSKYPINEFEKDYKKIISSAVFRRLQDKTQVFPLDKSDFVRTRLTHSIEVSTIAKQLGGMITKGVALYQKNTKHSIDEQYASQISDVLMCAGLLHDLGNPPFGHFGEVIIGDWFKKQFSDANFNYRDGRVTEILSGVMIKDLENFEGNAQALRILSKCNHNNKGTGLNLTYAVINTLIKYPVDSLSFNKDSRDVREHKFGVFESEKQLFQAIASETGTFDTDNKSYRHPLTFILEAADDIAYATADLEDAFKKGLFSIDEFIVYYDNTVNELKEKYGKKSVGKSLELIDPLREAVKQISRNNENDARNFNEWVAWARNWLMYVVAYRFTTDYNLIMSGRYKNDLFFDTLHNLSIKALKKAMGKFVFHSSGILKLELAAQTIIDSLFDKFIPAVMYYGITDGAYQQTDSDKKLTDLISDNLKNDYENSKTDNEAYNLYLRFLLVTDYISGMTDSFAKGLFQELNGY